MIKIGIFGGSFDPVHNGHVGIARRAIAEFGLDRLIVIPAAVSPFKTGNRPGALGYDRLALVQAAFAEMEKVVVDDRELRRGGVSYSIDTVREIHAELTKELSTKKGAQEAEAPGAEGIEPECAQEAKAPGAEGIEPEGAREAGAPGAEGVRRVGFSLLYLIGEDSVAGLPRWKAYDELVRLCTFKSFPRTRESSTEVRRRLLAGEPIDDLVPPSVATLIAAGRSSS